MQKRLPQELRLAGISTLEVANRFITGTFLPTFNARFMVAAAEEGSAFVPFTGTLQDILCIQEERDVQNDNTVPYKGLALQIPEQRHRRHFVKAKVKVHKYPGGELAIFHGPRLLARYDQKGNLIESDKQKRAA